MPVMVVMMFYDNPTRVSFVAFVRLMLGTLHASGFVFASELLVLHMPLFASALMGTSRLLHHRRGSFSPALSSAPMA